LSSIVIEETPFIIEDLAFAIISCPQLSNENALLL
jgi:hypothetical protein